MGWRRWHQRGAFFAKAFTSKGWSGAVAQQQLQCCAVVRLDADAGVHLEAAVLVGQHVFGVTTLQQARPTKARRMRRRKSVCTWATAVSSIALAG